MATTVTVTTADGSKHSLDLPDADAQKVAADLKSVWQGVTDPGIKGSVYSNLGSVPAWCVKTEAITAVDLTQSSSTKPAV